MIEKNNPMLSVKTSQKVSDYVQQISKASVKIETVKSDGSSDIGSGFFVAPRILVSCAHILGITPNNQTPSTSQIKIILYDEQVFQGRVIDYDVNLDVSLIYTDISPSIKTYFLNLGNSGNIKEGEMVVTLGSPLGYTNAVSYGIVSKKYHNNNNYFLLDLRTNPGNSGGLIFSLDKHAVIGISVAVYNAINMQSEGISLGVAIDVIKNILKRNNIKFVYHEIQEMA